MSELSESKCPKCGELIPEQAPHGLCPKCVLADVSLATQEETRRGSRHAPPEIDRLAKAFPDLEIQELIGQGGMGFVYRARQLKLERDVALKVLPEALAEDPAFAERFTREGRLLAKLNHPNIVTVFDFGRSGPFFFLTMEYVDGLNLSQAMKAGSFTPEQALCVIPKICEALQYAHDTGVLHRDVKPENILMTGDGNIKIADFGIAKMVGEFATDPGLTVSGAKIGTPHYMAPEQVESSGKVDHRADIYSLGVVFYELLTGELPLGRFEAPSDRAILDRRIDEIVLRSLERNRERRQQSASEVKTQVEGLKDAPPQDTASQPPSSQAKIESARQRTLAPAVGLSLVALVNFVRLIPSSTGTWFFDPGTTLIDALFSIPGLILAIVGLLISLSAYTLARIEHRGLSLFGATLALVSFPWTIIGFPIGIWALNVLHSPEVKSVFPDYNPDHGTMANPWPRRIFWLIVAVIVTPVLALMLSLIIAAVSYTKFEGSPPKNTGPAAIQQETGELTASIGTGSLTLIGIRGHREPETTWRTAVGNDLPELGIDSSSISISPETDESAYEFLIQENQLPTGTTVLGWSASPSFSSSGTGTPRKEGQHDRSLTLIAGAVGAEVTHLDLLATVAVGGFTTVASCSPEAVRNNQYSHQAGSKDGHAWELTFSIPHHDAESTVVVLAHDVEDREIRVIATHQEGNQIEPTEMQRGSQHLTARFEGLDLSTVADFSAQTREHQIVTFPNIQLGK